MFSNCTKDISSLLSKKIYIALNLVHWKVTTYHISKVYNPLKIPTRKWHGSQLEKAVINYQSSPKVYSPSKWHWPMCFCIIKKHIISSLDFYKISPNYLRISTQVCFLLLQSPKDQVWHCFADQRSSRKTDSVESYPAFSRSSFLAFKWGK